MQHAPRSVPVPAFTLRILVLAALVALASAACTDSGGDAGPGSTVAAPDDGITDTTVVPDQSATVPSFTEPPVPAQGWNIDAALATEPCENPPPSEAPLRIGYAGLGGDASAADRDIQVALQHLGQQINCSGGLNGQTVEMSFADISGNAVDTRNQLRQLVIDEATQTPKIDVLFGPPEADPGLRILVVSASQWPVIFIGATEPGLADVAELSYLVSFDDTEEATVAAQFARSQGWSRAATVSAPGPYYGYTANVFAEVFTSAGGAVLADYGFEPAVTIDFGLTVEQMAADPPEVIYSSMSAEQAVQLKNQLAAANLTPNLLLSDSFEKTGGYTLDDAAIEGIYHVTHAFPATDSRAARLYSSISASNELVSSFSYPALAGDAFAVVADAFLRADRTNPDVPLAQSLGQAIPTADSVVGVSGVLSYRGNAAPEKLIYVQQVQGGAPVLVHQHGMAGSS